MGPIKDQLGMSRLRNAFTGGEAIGEDTFVFYRALGVRLRQLYGQTESSAFNAMQDPDEVRLHTVGRPLPGRGAAHRRRRRDPDSLGQRLRRLFPATRRRPREVLARTAGCTPATPATWSPTASSSCWAASSEVVHTAHGERYIPNYIENRLKFSPYIKDVAVLGRGRDSARRDHLHRQGAVGHWAELRGISYMSYADLSQKPEVIALLAGAVRHVNTTLPEGLRLRHFVSLHKEFDPDDGEITRTRKLRRNVVEERYAPIIDAIYGGQQARGRCGRRSSTRPAQSASPSACWPSRRCKPMD